MAPRKGKATASSVEKKLSRLTNKMSSDEDLTLRDLVSRESGETAKVGVVTRKRGSLSQSSGHPSPFFRCAWAS